jgi:ribosomal protein S18 acetylase RimI-like enzyme
MGAMTDDYPSTVEQPPGGPPPSSYYLLPVSSVTVRRAVERDVPGIASIHVRSWQAAYRGLVADEVLDGLSVEEREQSWRALLDQADGQSFTLVADLGGRIAGFCSVATPGRDESLDERAAELTALYVDPVFWRGGVGAALLGAALDELREGGWREVTLWVLPENDRARSFYAGFGFEADGREKREERSGRVAVHLRASLIA